MGISKLHTTFSGIQERQHFADHGNYRGTVDWRILLLQDRHETRHVRSFNMRRQCNVHLKITNRWKATSLGANG